MGRIHRPFPFDGAPAPDFDCDGPKGINEPWNAFSDHREWTPYEPVVRILGTLK